MSKTLYPLLDNAWFASNGAPYTKRYNDLCALLDIKAHTQLSRMRHQLDPSNDELVREQFVARYDYPLKPDGEWSGNVRWWPGPKWLYDQEQKRQRHAIELSGVTAPLTTPAQPHMGNGDGSPQLLLPLPTQRRVVDDDLSEKRVRTFYEKLGQSRPSREQIRAGVAVLHNLVEEQGYSWDEIDFTMEWMLSNLQRRFNGTIQSFGLMTHVIGEALKEKASRERQWTQQEVRVAEERQEAKQVAQRKLREKQLASLPPADQQVLRREAIESLAVQGVKSEFMLESLIKSEMLRMIESRAPTALRGR